MWWHLPIHNWIRYILMVLKETSNNCTINRWSRVYNYGKYSMSGNMVKKNIRRHGRKSKANELFYDNKFAITKVKDPVSRNRKKTHCYQTSLPKRSMSNKEIVWSIVERKNRSPKFSLKHFWRLSSSIYEKSLECNESTLKSVEVNELCWKF